MTTTPAMPELPEPYTLSRGDEDGPIQLGYTADQMRAYALATLQAQPAEVSDAELLGAIARGWCHPKNSGKEVDADLAAAIAEEIRAILALRPQSESETFDQWLKRERPAGAVSDMERGWNACAASLRPQAVPRTDEPQWIVNDLGELGVKVGPRFFFLYKGDNIEYGTDGIGDSRDGVALHDDGTPMHYRIVGKREFGETCWPLQWVVRGHSEGRYTEPLTFIPGLSWGKPEDGEWKPLPSRGITAPAGGEG